MTDVALLEKFDALSKAVMFMAQQNGQRLSRADLCERLNIHRNTLAKRLEDPTFPRPDVNGKWLLSEVLDWELHR